MFQRTHVCTPQRALQKPNPTALFDAVFSDAGRAHLHPVRRPFPASRRQVRSRPADVVRRSRKDLQHRVEVDVSLYLAMPHRQGAVSVRPARMPIAMRQEDCVRALGPDLGHVPVAVRVHLLFRPELEQNPRPAGCLGAIDDGEHGFTPVQLSEGQPAGIVALCRQTAEGGSSRRCSIRSRHSSGGGNYKQRAQNGGLSTRAAARARVLHVPTHTRALSHNGMSDHLVTDSFYKLCLPLRIVQKPLSCSTPVLKLASWRTLQLLLRAVPVPSLSRGFATWSLCLNCPGHICTFVTLQHSGFVPALHRPLSSDLFALSPFAVVIFDR